MSGAVSLYDGTEKEPPPNNNPLQNGGGATKKLSRGISRATENAAIVSHARSQLVPLGAVDTPEFTFSLPDLSVYPDGFRQFLERDLIEGGCLASLETAGRLNWWCGTSGKNGASRVLWPLATSGDGNCLLHAASLGMWGFHDRLLTLRDALHTTLAKGECRHALYRRWKWRQMALNAVAGLAYSAAEWTTEWQSVVDMASAHPRNPSANSYQSLEEVHVLALAHVLCRPIIVIAETMLRDAEGVALAPIPFGGVYLPFEVPPSRCHRTPLLLAYHSAHFSPLVTVDGTGSENGSREGVSIPLVDPDTGMLLPILFSVDPGPHWDSVTPSEALPTSLTEVEDFALLRQYLDCDYQLLTADEIERYSESENSSSNKSRAAKQLLGVAKQFGSIGKSVSRRLWSMAKRPKSPPSASGASGALCVQIRSKRHQYADQMLQNYLQCAHARYLREQRVETTGHEMNYGAGKSKFYAASDKGSHVSVSKLLPTNPNSKDRTLYLSRSTFYNNQPASVDSRPETWNNGSPIEGDQTVRPCRNQDCAFFGSVENQYYCSKCWADRPYR
ncbi:OTU domain-containing protein 7B-like isoform X2 [Athalia rosae]|nr:OTU domain-containing protein 7B-like isoform X2 [Athalia rosae]XP_012261457.1 OTU domain-containing protein 7B-like isoform X2 [Athalia rosae]XP_012261458.1 OTU domain-containing protein 7B-like isoform X2 [Athalia rosae]XP_020709811.1 OTU domain-containing protein 7B-like isoform X2 [Athalia rosae]XP_048512270.1 OTU domain-containing protein 7B-like isoform X2 [Athalia rosae]